MKTLADYWSGRLFRFIHGGFLVYNTCWEDPRLDREVMDLGPEDEVLMITSAGCNVLDYLLDEPAGICAVDMNPRQNALLELKLAAIRRLEHAEFFELFGRGRHPAFGMLYLDVLRGELSAGAREYWDRHQHFFEPRGPSFYHRGTSGTVARLMVGYLRYQGVLERARELFEVEDLEKQAEVFRRLVRPRLWREWLRWCLGREALHGMLGVPKSQRVWLEQSFPGGIVGFMEHAVDQVFARLPLHDNYFWRVYLFGEYVRGCCPRYLEEANFHRLKSGLIDRVRPFTGSLLECLESGTKRYSKFVLLDHMDWLWEHHPEVLARQWQRIVDRSVGGAGYLWRSAGLGSEFLDAIPVGFRGDWAPLKELLGYDRERAARLHARDRVHTYGSFHVASLAV